MDFWLNLALGVIQVYSGYLQVFQEVLSKSNKIAGLNALHLLFHPIFAQNMIYNICCKLLCAAVKPAGQLNSLNDLANEMKRSNSQQVRYPVTTRRKKPYIPDYFHLDKEEFYLQSCKYEDSLSPARRKRHSKGIIQKKIPQLFQQGLC